MTKKDLLESAYLLCDESIAMLTIKNRDYAVGDDAFHNFDTVAQFLGSTREQVLATYLYKHLSAIFAYTRGEYADSEPIRGRIKDAINYLIFLAAMNDDEDPDASFAATNGREYVDGAGQRLVNIHHPDACEGKGCAIHHPSDHHMKDWATNWRYDRGIMERICEHGIGHPDPDDQVFLASVGRTGEFVHGCDGCCLTTTTPYEGGPW